MSSIARGVGLVLVVGGLAGCPPQNPPYGGSGYGSSPSPSPPPVATQPPTEASGTASCWDLLQCTTPCGADAACQDACARRGDATARAQLDALLACSAGCANETGCIRTTCAAVIDTCRGSATTATAPPTTTLPQPHPTENLIPWLTGDWQSATYQFQFKPDGTVQRSLAVYARGSCASTIVASGPVTQEGDVLIMDLGAEDAHSCGAKVEGAGPRRVRYRIGWIANGGTALQLRLLDLDCTKGGDLYCAELMVRR